MSSDTTARQDLEQKFTVVNLETLPQHLDAAPMTALFFPGDPKRYPESMDVAVILPLLEKHFSTRLQTAIVASDIEKSLQQKYGFTVWPSVIFLSNAGYHATISRVQDWQSYLEQITKILELPPSRPPGIGIPVKTS